MSEEQLHDKIEQYLLLELSPAEATAFEVEMEQDATLKAQVERQRLALLGLERLATLDLKEKFRAWDAETDAPEVPGNVSLPRAFNVWKWISTGLLALLVIAVLFLVKHQPKDTTPAKADNRDSLVALTADFRRVKSQLDSLLSLPRATGDTTLQGRLRAIQEELARKDRKIRVLQNKGGRPNREYAAQFAPAFEAYNPRGGQDAVIAEFKKAYNARDFKQAETLLASIPENDPKQEFVVAFLPFVLFYQQKYEEAIPPLLLFKSQGNDLEAQKVDWFLLLCYTADMQAHGIKAGVLLKEITGNSRHLYYEDAKKLEAKLKADGVL